MTCVGVPDYQATAVQQKTVQCGPQAVKRHILGTALHELSCTASDLSCDSYSAVLLDVLAEIQGNGEPRASFWASGGTRGLTLSGLCNFYACC